MHPLEWTWLKRFKGLVLVFVGGWSYEMVFVGGGSCGMVYVGGGSCGMVLCLCNGTWYCGGGEGRGRVEGG